MSLNVGWLTTTAMRVQRSVKVVVQYRFCPRQRRANEPISLHRPARGTDHVVLAWGARIKTYVRTNLKHPYSPYNLSDLNEANEAKHQPELAEPAATGTDLSNRRRLKAMAMADPGVPGGAPAATTAP